MAKGKWVSKRQRSEVVEALKEHAGKLIDRISTSDALEITAVIGVTSILLATPSFVERAVEVAKQDWWLAFMPAFGVVGTVTGYLIGATKVLSEPEKIKMKTDWRNILVCVTIAYLIVHNFGLLIQTTGNIASSIGTLGLKLLG